MSSTMIKAGRIHGVKTIGGSYKIPRSELKRFESELKYEPRQVEPPRRQPQGETPAIKEKTGKARRAPKGKARADPEERDEDEDEFDE